MIHQKNTLRVNEKRLWDTLLRSAEIGRVKSGALQRLALSDADRDMRDQFVTWCRESGCTVKIDQAGNIFSRIQGREDLPAVVIGSHLDTQVDGGRFDGILGVLSGLEVVRTLQEHDITPKRPIEVVDWTNEEGARFPPPFAGSLVFSGERSIDWLYSLEDDDHLTFGDELRRIGYVGDTPIGNSPFDSYFELHIEQGPILYEAGIPVGVVVGGYAAKGMNVIFRGQTGHVGPTPMNRRHNALVGAAKYLTAVNDIGWRFAPIGKATASRVRVWPNKNGIIPSYTEVTVDMRHQDPEQTDQMHLANLQALERCAKEAFVEFELQAEWNFGGDIRFDSQCITNIRNAAIALDVPTMDIYSQAGHDAYVISYSTPTAMIFTPCVDGISHNRAENIIPEQTWPSINVLLHAVLARAER